MECNSMLKEYKLSTYQDYGPLGNKEHIHLVRNKISGKISVKKNLGKEQREIIEFRKKNVCVYFPEILEVIENEEQMIVIEEYIEGITLEDYMMGKALPENEAVKIARQICEALRLLHSAVPMIVYRDLKAENVMLTSEGNIKLVDFDISRKYQEGKKRDTRLLGTAEYAAPEQFGYFQTDNRTDIYAFGVLFNYMLTGKFPVEFMTESIYEEIIRKCVELEPGKRYQSVDEILSLLPVLEAEKNLNEEVEKVQEEKDLTWILPGFRTKKLQNMIIAICGYGFILWFGVTVEFMDANDVIYPAAKLWLNRIMFTIAQFAAVLFNFNYRGILGKIPFLNQLPQLFRVILFAVSWFVFIVLAVLITAGMEVLFEI